MVYLKAIAIVTILIAAVALGAVTKSDQHNSLLGISLPFGDGNSNRKIENVYVLSNDPEIATQIQSLIKNRMINIVILKDNKIDNVKAGDVLIINIDNSHFKVDTKLFNDLEKRFLEKKGIVILYTEKGMPPSKLSELTYNMLPLSFTGRQNVVINRTSGNLYYVFALRLLGGDDNQVPVYYSLYSHATTKIEPADICKFISSIVSNTS
ncbi:MAG: hypothetical protein F7B60_03950 [Desulfurococcales archaeon]|nr:hypothetical protein [Desulfurococcales archaeon]